MEDSRQAVAESLCISRGLCNRRRQVKPLDALALDMDSRQADKIRHAAIGQGAAALDIVAIRPEQIGKLPLTVSALPL